MALRLVTYFLSNGIASILFATLTFAISEYGSWTGHRGAQIQSKIVLEGGILLNASGGVVGNPLGVYYQINLADSFDVSNQEVSDYVVAGPNETVYDNQPVYFYGGLFCNNYQFYTFGGIPSDYTNDTGVLLGHVYPPDPNTPPAYFAESFTPNISTGRVSGSRAAGAYVSAPDQGLGFYFSGLIAPNGTSLVYSSADEPGWPSVAVTDFISVNMETADEPVFAYLNFPEWLAPRAEASLVWLPYGDSGALVVLGGVENPGDLLQGSGPANDYMAQVAIYDIANDVWALQDTEGLPTNRRQRASFCAVVVPTADKYSQEIIVYGGYDGQSTEDSYDDVWILSVPAFQWTSLSATNRSTSTHRRQGSICIAPNPSTMITIGGSGPGGSPNPLNDPNYFVDVLDLNSGNWTGMYNSSSSTKFSASEELVAQLKWPNAEGPGTDSLPTSLNDTLTQLFSTRYAGVVQSYFPYSNYTPPRGNSPNSTSTSSPSPTPGPQNPWKIPVIATVCSVVPALIIAITAWCCIRKYRKRKDGAEHTQQSQGRVFSWLSRPSQSYPLPEKSVTSGTTGETATSSHPDYFRQHGYKNMNGEIYEAPSAATSPGLISPASPGSPGMMSPQTYEMMDHGAFNAPPTPQTGATANHPSPNHHERSSQFSESFPSPERAARNAGPIPLYELAQDRTASNTLDSASRAQIMGARNSDTLSQDTSPASRTSPRVTNSTSHDD